MSTSLIDFNSYPVKNVLGYLTKDKTTKQNIIFATTAYADFGITETTPVNKEVLFGRDHLEKEIRPRVEKSLEKQSERTKNKAEVFTPAWICNKMNNVCDDEWFGKKGVFNTEEGQVWTPTETPIPFERPRDWQKYVDSKRLEITCGEAPYLVSRYDTTTGEIIPIKCCIGLLDRKLRVVNENTKKKEDWLKWTYRAFESVYGYEYQGDNLLIARINLLNTFVDYMQDRWNCVPTDAELKKITNTIVWNLWQMDGLTGLVPFGKPRVEYQQLTLFDYSVGEEEKVGEDVGCKIMDWRADRSILFRNIKDED